MTNLEIFLLATTLLFLICYLVQRSIYLTDCVWFKMREQELLQDRKALREGNAQQVSAISEEHERQFKRMEHAICTLASWDHGQAGAAQIRKLITEG